MHIALGIMAAVILLIYGFYIVRILAGRPYRFEAEITNALEFYLEQDRHIAVKKLWKMISASLVLEIVYFILSFMVLVNPVMIILSFVLVGEEILHLSLVFKRFSDFSRGKVDATRLFNWTFERISAIMFFTHAFLVLVTIIIYM